MSWGPDQPGSNKIDKDGDENSLWNRNSLIERNITIVDIFRNIIVIREVTPRHIIQCECGV